MKKSHLWGVIFLLFAQAANAGLLYTTSNSFNDIESFNPLTGQRINHFSGNCANEMAFGPDGNLYCGTGDIVVLDPTTGAAVRQITTLNETTTIAFAPDGTLYATSNSFNDIEVFNPLTGVRLNLFSGNCANEMAFGPDGNLYCGAGDIGVLNPSTGATIRKITTLNETTAIAFSASGDLYATSTTFNNIEVFNPLTGIRLSHFSGNCSHDMAFGPDGNLYCAPGDIDVLNPTTGVTIRTIVTLHESTTLVFTPPTPVTIDIKPSKKPENVISLKKDKNLKVAIVGSESFDALQVDPATVKFGPGEASPVRFKGQDYNRDGYSDLVLTFKLKETGIDDCSINSATLTGQTIPDPVIYITGSDSFTVEPCP